MSSVGSRKAGFQTFRELPVLISTNTSSSDFGGVVFLVLVGAAVALLRRARFWDMVRIVIVGLFERRRVY